MQVKDFTYELPQELMRSIRWNRAITQGCLLFR